MKRAIAIIALGLTFGAVPLLMGPSGGFPARPRFQSVGVGVVAPANAGQLSLSGSVGAAGLAQSSTNTNNGATSFGAWRLMNDAGHTMQMGQTSSTAASAFIYAGGPTTEQGFLGTNENVPVSFGVNGTEVMRLTNGAIAGPSNVSMTPSTGTFASNVQGTGCTTGSVTWSWYKMGSTVTMKITARTNFPAACSGGTMADTSGNFPVAIRPTNSTSNTPSGTFTNNGTVAPGCVALGSTGNISYGIADATGCNLTGWTGAGNRDFAVGSGVSYTTF
jgi:hypothetical protein